jgi:hypothetical protein
MWKRKTVSALILGFMVVFVLAGSERVHGWSNGGYSADPENTDYGTHDWIAEHALDWLPPEEKQFLLDNKAVYLYGTELPDNGQAADGIGDTTKHHVYYSADGSVQDDVAADRAEAEYAKAVDAYNAGNFSNAAKQLGIVTHYIVDVAVFGHVMGEPTAWGTETHHSDYEDYVKTRTNSYVDDFDSFLGFDGSLSPLSAYDATLALAYDTTFDVGGQYTCVWMDQHYDWNDVAFRDRCGASLNLAVNTVADVLHTFYTDVVIPEFPSTLALLLLILLALPAAFLAKKKRLRKAE